MKTQCKQETIALVYPFKKQQKYDKFFETVLRELFTLSEPHIGGKGHSASFIQITARLNKLYRPLYVFNRNSKGKRKAHTH